MEIQEVAAPLPGPGEVVVRPRLSAICGSDLHGFREASPRRIPPLIMGHETVGKISSVGAGVRADRVGERVVVKPMLGCGACEHCRSGDVNRCAAGRLLGRDLPGGFAEAVVVPSTAAEPIPAALSDDVAVLTEPLANAVHVARRGVEKGSTVLVIGSGPIGVLMARAALLDGASRVFITDPASERLRFAEAQGAERLEGDDLAVAVREATGGEGVDLVIDAAGFETTWALGLSAVRTGGRMFQVGLGAPSGALDYFAVLGKEVSITGSYAWSEQDFERALELLVDEVLDLSGWITRMPLAEGAQAFEELADRTSRFKIALEL
jgi:2-desacetyl-2-hydroxyethyl bacteriochlorophyllide A dehydrogenase